MYILKIRTHWDTYKILICAVERGVKPLRPEGSPVFKTGAVVNYLLALPLAEVVSADLTRHIKMTYWFSKPTPLPTLGTLPYVVGVGFEPTDHFDMITYVPSKSFKPLMHPTNLVLPTGFEPVSLSS